MSTGLTLKVFLVAGAPNGLLTAEIMNWTGHVLTGPHSRLSEWVQRPEARRTGVYFLVVLQGRFTEELLETSLRELVDLWHLLQKVGKALRTRYSEARTASELRTWKPRLLNRSNAATAPRDELRSWLDVPEDEPLGEGYSLKEAVGFLTRQLRADRLDYAAARRAGHPVGSGPVAASCKCVFNVRLKRSGCGSHSRAPVSPRNLRNRYPCLSTFLRPNKGFRALLGAAARPHPRETKGISRWDGNHTPRPSSRYPIRPRTRTSRGQR